MPSSNWDPRELAVDPSEPINPLADPTRPSQAPPPPPPPRRSSRPSPWQSLLRPLAILAVAGAIAGVIIGYQSLRASDVQLLNGFDFPVQVALRQGDEETVLTIPPRGRVEQSVVGEVAVRATRESGELLSEETVDVPRGHDLVAYNVLGAAAVYSEEILYTTAASRITSRPPATEHHAGQTFILREHVQYVFETPDDEISLSTTDDEASRWHFGYIGDGSWSASLNVLIGQGAREPAQRVLDAVLQADPQNAMAQSFRSYLQPPPVPQAPAFQLGGPTAHPPLAPQLGRPTPPMPAPPSGLLGSGPK